jgi:hypothetical protein
MYSVLNHTILLFIYVSMGAVGARCCPALLLAFLLICYLLFCSCSEQSRLKSPIPIQNMPLCSDIQFFSDGGPLLGTLVATTPSSKCFSHYFRPTSIPIDSSAGNSKWYVCDGFCFSRIAISFWYKLHICMLMLREYEITTFYLPIYIQYELQLFTK